MATVTVYHTPSGGPADPSALVDGPTYDGDPHIVSGLENVPNVDTTNASNLASGTVPAARIAETGKPFVILATGQSNLVHEVTLSNTPNVNATRWNNGLGTEGSVGTGFAALPTTTINVADKFASDLADNNLTRPVKLINLSFAGMPIAQWLSGASTAGPLIDCFAEIQANISAALTAAGVSKIDCFLWWQGESDSSTTTYVANFATMMARFFADTTAGAGWFPQQTPVVIFGISPTSISTDAGSDKVNNYLQAIVGNDADKRRFIYTGSLSAAAYWVDTLHMTAAGYYAAGAMASSAFLNGPGRPSVRNITVDPVTGYVNVGGYGTADAPLTINNNTALPATSVGSGVSYHSIGADGVNHNTVFDAYAGSNVLVGRRRDGTIASLSAVGAASQVFSQQASAWNGSTLPTIATFDALTVNAQTGIDNSSRYRMRLIPAGSTTLAEYHSWTAGAHVMGGKTSGTVTFSVPDVAGTRTVSFPAANIDFAAAAEMTRLFGGFLVSKITGVNFNSANTDNAITLPTLPDWATRFIVNRVYISHASQTLTTSTHGVFTNTGGGGTAIQADTATTVNTASDATASNIQNTATGFVGSFVLASLPVANTIYFRVGTAQGAAATADVTLFIIPVS